MTITPEEIEAAKTPSGGYSRAQLEKWGVSWPPAHGWKRELMQEYQEAIARDDRRDELRTALKSE